jgi:hypothetical protein
MNTCLIKTANGLTITVKDDVSNPRPYDRINTIAGAKGIFTEYPPRIYLDGQKGEEAWASLDAFKEYEHPVWRQEGDVARKAGVQGGMDFIMLYRLLECLRKGVAPDMDVYDTAAWSSVRPSVSPRSNQVAARKSSRTSPATAGTIELALPLAKQTVEFGTIPPWKRITPRSSV